METETTTVWTTTKIEDEREEEQTNNGNNLDRSETKLGFTINPDREDVEEDDDGKNQGDPTGNHAV